MHVDVRRAEDVIIVDFEGKLVAPVGDILLRDVINELLAEDWKKILLNMSQVSKIDSSGVGELADSLRTANKFGASLKITQLNTAVMEILRLSQVLPLFEIYDDEQEALTHF